jgi:AcrR family transcriptional regulator
VIFPNFGSKAALFAVVVERAAAEVRASLDDLAAGSGAPSGLLAHVLTWSAHGEPAPSAPGPAAGHAPGEHAAAACGVLFGDAAALTAEPALSKPARDAVRAVAAHLANLIRHAPARGEVSPGADPEAAAWLLLSVMSARRLREAAMPASLEPGGAELALQALAPPAPAAGERP